VEVAVSDDTAREGNSTITPADKEARAAFLNRYAGYTRDLYAGDLRIYFQWCAERGMSPLSARRRDLEAFLEHLTVTRQNRTSSARRRMHTLRGFYALAVDDEAIERDPTRMLRLPKLERDPDRLVWLDRFQVGALLRAAEAASPAHHALVALMAIGGLRVTAACIARLEGITTTHHGAPTLRVREKGSRVHTVDVPPVLSEIIETARAGRAEGPIVTRRDGTPQDRNGAYAWVRALGVKAGIGRVNPHALRRAAITMVFDGGGTIQDAREFAGHADIRTTEQYHPTRGVRGIPATYLTAAAFTTVA
jgi:site-specific recombinase XerD